MPTISQLEKLIVLLQSIPEDGLVVFDTELEDDCEWTVKPIIDGIHVMAYLVTNKVTLH